jgi:hypothetical protein
MELHFHYIPPRGGEQFYCICTDKKEKKIFLLYKEMQSGAVAMSYMRRPLVIYDFATAPL